jgi:hypothetical protein
MAILLVPLATTGCSAAPGGQAGSTTDAGVEDSSTTTPSDGWDARTNVEAVFAASCSGCHGAQWSTCWDVQASATAVEDAIVSGAMPRGGPLSPSDESTVLTWLMQGAPCAGTMPSNPDDGGVFGGGGPPLLAGSILPER